MFSLGLMLRFWLLFLRCYGQIMVSVRFGLQLGLR